MTCIGAVVLVVVVGDALVVVGGKVVVVVDPAFLCAEAATLASEWCVLPPLTAALMTIRTPTPAAVIHAHLSLERLAMMQR